MPDSSLLTQYKKPGFVVYFLLTVAYVITGKLGMMLALPPSYAAPIFLPAGIAVAAALIGGIRALPWIFIGALIVAGQSSHAAAVLIATASVLQAAVGGWVLRSIIGYPTMLEKKQEVLRFLAAIPMICLISSGLSVTGMWVLGIVDVSGLLGGFATWWVGDALGVMVMFPLTMIMVGEPRALWRSRLLTVALPIVLIFTIFVVIYIKSCQWESAESLSDFRQLSQQSVDQVRSKLEEQAIFLEQMDEFFLHDAGGHVSRGEFHLFVQKSLQRFPMIQALEWAPYVEASSRAKFVADQRHDLSDFDILERDAAGKLRHAGNRSAYYPVTFVEPMAGNEPASGFDLASDDTRKEAISRAINNGTITASASVRLVQENQQQAGVLLFYAVKPHEKTSGIVLTVLRMDDFMDMTLHNNRSMLSIRLVDLDDQKIIYSNFPPETHEALYAQTFDFATRHYRLETAPTAFYNAQHNSTWISWFVLVIGNLFAGLMGAFLLVDTGHIARIEAEVINRTRRLTESESRIRFVLEHSPIALHITTLDSGSVVFANQAYADLICMSERQLVGVNTLRYYVNPEDYTDVLEKLAQGEQVTNKLVELQIPNAHSNHKWALASYMRLEFEGRQAVLGWFYDISAQKRTEQQIQILVQEQKAMLENDLVGIVRVKDRIITWANPSFENMLGYRPGELNGSPTRINFISDDAYTTLGVSAYPKLAEGGIYRTQIEHRCKDGQVKWVDMSGSMLNVDRGESLWVFLDISERKVAEEKLRYSEQRFRDVSDAAGEYLWELDANMVYTYVSARSVDVKGYTPDELVGRTPMEFMPEEDIVNVGNIVNRAIAIRAPFKLQHRDITKTGAVVWEEVNGVPIYDKNAQVIGLRGTGLNISERKKMEVRVHQLAFYDSLTKLPNRRLLDERLTQAIAASRRSARYGALMFLDLDNFKPLNDTHGHGVGDLLLIEVAIRLRNCVREIDTVARFGGDEFVVILSDLDAEKAASMLQAQHIAEKIRTILSLPYYLNLITEGLPDSTVEHHCSASIGIAMFNGKEGSQQEIMKWADVAMYAAKKGGRNIIEFFDADDTEEDGIE